jgi:ATP-dependent DNA helicase RecQ
MDLDLKAPLKKHFGYDEFRPLQEEIIRDAVAGRDVFVLMPTGGGKSLCFQLPALLRDGVTIVVSPLIALMKDQVDALQTSGIAATFLNSSLERRDAAARWRGLHRGEYRMLYVAPERLMLDHFLESALNWNIAQFAIDEAHCISEWGHDFRPEYRQLAKLRTHFPDVPIMALTATATERVRADILKQLKLHEVQCYIGSFNRPNLTYRVVPKSSAYDQLLSFLRARPNDSGIVYCASRKATDSLAARLQEDGIAAKPYHAGMESAHRSKHQDAFLRDDVRVITATIAFGMGINKPNVRFVLHYDLPKNLESYYQETGRAGRDGLPSDCVLLFSASDVVKQRRFIEEKEEREQRIAHEQLRTMVAYAETRDCRRATLLRYFGEQLPGGSCSGCDNCENPRETFDGTVPAQKFLSCVRRVQQKSGFSFGLNHIVDVLVGADTEPIRQRGHDQISTYGIGRELARGAWQAIGRELLRIGLVAAAPGKFATLQLTPEGWTALRQRTSIILTKPFEVATPKPSARRAGAIECDEELFERLRILRRKVADERNLPAYIIFSDATLREMAHRYPTTPAEFRAIPGIGEQKLKDFAAPFLAEITAYLKENPKKSIDSPAAARSIRCLNDSERETLRRFRNGQSLDEIAGARGFVRSTICSHLLRALETGQPLEKERFFTPAAEEEMRQAFGRVEGGGVVEVSALLGGKYGIETLRFFRGFERRSVTANTPARAIENETILI